MSDYVVSIIRTWVPIIVGSALAWLATKIGFVVDEETEQSLTLAFSGVVIGAYYAVVRWLETRYPALGRLLGRRATPTYTSS